MRIVFLGTPDFAVGALRKIIESRHELLAVITQPDKLGNRKQLTIPPVKEEALKHGIKVLQYNRISKEGIDELKALNPDIMVTAAYGQILSKEILAIPKFGVINIHASLLPKYRGSSPIQWAIINGEQYSGVTIMQTEYEVDSGAIIAAEQIAIDEGMTAGDLFDKLSEIGARLIVKVLDDIESGQAHYTEQDSTQATYCKMLTKADGKIDFSKNYFSISCFVRGMSHWPIAHCEIGGCKFKIHKVIHYSGNVEICDCECGTVAAADFKNGLIIKCADGYVRLLELQAENGKRMMDIEYLRGHSVDVGCKVI